MFFYGLAVLETTRPATGGCGVFDFKILPSS
jgi:hypothetical protein